MARLSKNLTEQDYYVLVKQLLLSHDLDTEIQDCHLAYVRNNPKFYLLVNQAIRKIKEEASISEDNSQISELENLDEKLCHLERNLNENTNIIPADLPDSIR